MSNKLDEQYLKLIKKIIKEGVSKNDRTGTGTLSIFDTSLKINMFDGFPLLTSKKMFLKGIIGELLWFLGNHMKDEQYQKFTMTNIRYLIDNGINIWVGDAYKKYKKNSKNPLEKEDFLKKLKEDDEFCSIWGDLGPVYGQQWTNWNGINQIKNIIDTLKNDPDSRRLLVSAWNVADLDKMTLVPCHYSFQFWTRELDLNERIKLWCKSINKSKHYGSDMTHDELDKLKFPKRMLSLKWNQRSVDSLLGLPYNITSYALLLILIAREVNMIPEQLSFSGGDTHLYKNHIQQANQQISNPTYTLPKMEISNKSIFDLQISDFILKGYQSAGVIKAELSN